MYILSNGARKVNNVFELYFKSKPLKFENYHDANFVVADGTATCDVACVNKVGIIKTVGVQGRISARVIYGGVMVDKSLHSTPIDSNNHMYILCNYHLTHWDLDEIDAILRRHFQVHFLE